MTILDAFRIFHETVHLELRSCTTQGYANCIIQFATFVKNCDLRDLREEQFVNYFNILRSSPLKQNTLMLKCQALKKFVGFWHKRDFRIISPDLIPSIPREFNFARVADPEDFKRILALTEGDDVQSIRNRAIMLVLFDTGMRVGELCSMDIDEYFDLNIMQTVIKTKKSKGIKPVRQVMWRDETNECLRRWLEVRERLIERNGIVLKEAKALFIGCRGWQVGKRITNSCVEIFMRKYSRWAGLPYTLNPHSLRHRLGHDMAEAGLSNSTISGLLGHSSLSSSYRYTMMSGPEMRSEYNKFMQKRLRKG